MTFPFSEINNLDPVSQEISLNLSNKINKFLTKIFRYRRRGALHAKKIISYRFDLSNESGSTAIGLIIINLLEVCSNESKYQTFNGMQDQAVIQILIKNYSTKSILFHFVITYNQSLL